MFCLQLNCHIGKMSSQTVPESSLSEHYQDSDVILMVSSSCGPRPLRAWQALNAWLILPSSRGLQSGYLDRSFPVKHWHSSLDWCQEAYAPEAVSKLWHNRRVQLWSHGNRSHKFSLPFQEEVVSFTSCPKLLCIVAPHNSCFVSSHGQIPAGEGECNLVCYCDIGLTWWWYGR